MDESPAGCAHGSEFMQGRACVLPLRAEEAHNSRAGELVRTDQWKIHYFAVAVTRQPHQNSRCMKQQVIVVAFSFRSGCHSHPIDSYAVLNSNGSK